MRIGMLNPPGEFKVSKESRWPEFTKSGTLYFPAFLSYASAVLMEDKRHKVFLWDAIAKEWSWDVTINKVKEFSPDLLVMETTTPTLYKDIEFAELAKKEFPGVKIVFVGTHPSTLTIETMKLSPAIDMIARGEYDYTILDIANALENGDDLQGVQGIAYRRNGEIVLTAERPLVMDLDKIPFVSKAYKEFLDVHDYRYALAQHPMIQIWTSRGCPARCNFCVLPQRFTMHGYRKRSPQNVVDEVQWIKENLPDVKEIFFEDDTFTIDIPRADAICKEIISRKLKVVWSCNVRATLGYDILKSMKDAGCRILIVGYESGNQSVLNQIRKGTSLKQAEEFTKNAQKVGLRIFGCFMIGLSGDTKETIEETYQFAKKLNPDMVFFQHAMPFPGTEFYQWAKQNGYLLTENYNEWLDENGRLRCIVSYPGLTAAEIEALREHLMLRFYLRPKHIAYTVMRNLHPVEFVRVMKYALDYIGYRLSKGRVKGHDQQGKLEVKALEIQTKS